MAGTLSPGAGYDAGWMPNSTLSTVLDGYARFGGRLFGACRWEQNPLTLTHVRWEGPRGDTWDALRNPAMDDHLSAQERDVWVQLALGYPAGTADYDTLSTPWLPLRIAPHQAAHLAAHLLEGMRRQDAARSLALDPRDATARRAPTSHPYPPHEASSQPVSAPSNAQSLSPVAAGWAVERGGASGGENGMRAVQWVAGASPSPWAAATPREDGNSGNGLVEPGAIGTRGRFGPLLAQGEDGATVFPCVEIALPMAVTGPTAANAARDLARDVALTFRRATASLPAVREMRGWMRGDRLVLAARMVVSPGARVATPAEMEAAGRMLADALARFTLPYARLSYAAPGEWAEGRSLPE